VTILYLSQGFVYSFVGSGFLGCGLSWEERKKGHPFRKPLLFHGEKPDNLN
jgi:hypothetical protein